MKLAVCFFTYKKDLELLTQSVKAMQRLKSSKENEIDIFVIDDANASLDKIPDGVDFVATTEWDRKGNLNGIDNLKGMLGIYKDIIKDYDWIVKVDCDTVVNHFEWLTTVDPLTTPSVGTYNDMNNLDGHLYALSKAGVDALDKLVSREDISYRIGQGKGEEDRVFGVLLNMIELHPEMLINRQNEQGVEGPYVDNPETTIDTTTIVKNCCITFKRESTGRSEEEQAADRQTAVTRMTEYVNQVTA